MRIPTFKSVQIAACELANKAAEVKRHEYEEKKNTIAKALGSKYIPTIIQMAYECPMKGYKNYLGVKYQGQYFGIEMPIAIPQFDHIEIDAVDYMAVTGLANYEHEITNRTHSLENEIIQELLMMRDEATIREQFPEAIPYLVFENRTPIYEVLRKEINNPKPTFKKELDDSPTEFCQALGTACSR